MPAVILPRPHRAPSGIPGHPRVRIGRIFGSLSGRQLGVRGERRAESCCRAHSHRWGAGGLARGTGAMPAMLDEVADPRSRLVDVGHAISGRCYELQHAKDCWCESVSTPGAPSGSDRTGWVSTSTSPRERWSPPARAVYTSPARPWNKSPRTTWTRWASPSNGCADRSSLTGLAVCWPIFRCTAWKLAGNCQPRPWPNGDPP